MNKHLFAISSIVAGYFVLSSQASVSSESKDINSFLLNEARVNAKTQEFREEAINEYEKHLRSKIEREKLKSKVIIVKGDKVLVPKIRALLLKACNKDIIIKAKIKASKDRQDINATVDAKGSLQVRSESLNLPEKELLAMLSHELIHVFRKDTNFINAVKELNYKQLKEIDSVMNESEKKWLMTIQFLATKKIERKQEILADLTAAALMELSGYGYTSVEKLLTSFIEFNIQEDDFLQHLVGKDTKSHPLLQERIIILRQAKPEIIKLVDRLQSSNSCLDLSNPNISVEHMNL